MPDGAAEAVSDSDPNSKKGKRRTVPDGAAETVSDSDPKSKKGKSRTVPDGVAETVSDSDPQPGKGKGRKLLIAGAIVALLAVVGGGVSYFYARNPAADNTKAAEKVSQKAAEKVPQKATEKGPRKLMLYVPMDMFTVNLRNTAQERYLQVTINLEVADTMTADSLTQQMPSIRNRVLLLLSSKEAEELMTREGKEKLSAEISAELRKSLDGAGPSKGLEQVLFSHFVIQ